MARKEATYGSNETDSFDIQKLSFDDHSKDKILSGGFDL